jgi:hypothetical protein
VTYASKLLDVPIDTDTYEEFFQEFTLAIPKGLKVPHKTREETFIDDVSDWLGTKKSPRARSAERGT